MTETSLMPAAPVGGSLRLGADAYPTPTATPGANPLRMVYLFLRGRYLLLTVLIVALMPTGTWIGYKCGHTLFRSVGLIRVRPVGQKILFNNEENAQIPLFDEYLEAEAKRMASQRVLDKAMNDSEWRGWKSPLPDQWENTVAEEMVVTHQSELLNVTVWDSDPTAAMIAVKTIMTAYQEIYAEDTNNENSARDIKLEIRRNDLMSHSEDLRRQILTLASSNAYGTDDLSGAWQQHFEELSTLKKQREGYNESLAMYQRSGGGPESEEQAIARTNPRMASDLKDRDDLAQKLDFMKIDPDVGPNNFQVVRTKNQLDVIVADIQRMKLEFEQGRNVSTAAATPPGTRPSVAAGATTRPDPQAMLNAMIDKATAELAEIGREKLQIEDLKAQKVLVDQQLQETIKRQDELTLESSDSGMNARLELVSDGERAVRSADKKDTHIAMAALGGGTGLSLAILIVSMLALRDRRFHGPEDTQYSAVRIPMLGILPTLNSDLAEPEQAAMAAHFVHGIRAMLQIKSHADQGRVIAITSPSAHNGKTSLSLALGVSFAGAHSKTLLIDCDFVGRALTSRVNAVARPRLGRLLRQQGLVDDRSLEQGLQAAKRSGRRLGEVLVEMGAVSPDKLEAVLTAQKTRAFGVLEAIDGEDLAECVATTDIPGLSILPLGQANAEHIGSLSPAMLRQVLDTCRQRFDVVIVDTGPILGSLEAAMVATQADDVVVVLTAGENRAAAERSIRHLEGVGAKVAGFVFNRATSRDFGRSDNAQRVSSSANRWGHARSWVQSRQLANFGPVAQAVARSVGEINSANAEGNGHGNNGNGNGTGQNGESIIR
jgi:polysaccharide biosynthesis transport protein